MVVSSFERFFLRFFRVFNLIFVCLLIFIGTAKGKSIELGIVFAGNPVQTFKRWQPLAKYLSERTGANIKVVPMGYDAFTKWIKSDMPGIAICNLVIFSIFKNVPGLKPVAVPIWNVKGRGVHQYGAVVFTKKSNSIKSIQDVSGKIIAIPHKYSLAALLGLKTIKEYGVPLKTITIRAVKTHFNVVYGVINGVAKAGIVRTGVLEQMANLNKLNMKDIAVLNRKSDDFPYVHSTELVPEWFICVTRKVDPETSLQIQTALHGMNNDAMIAGKMKLMGWKNPEEFANFQVDEFIKIQSFMP